MNNYHYPWHQKKADHFARLMADDSLAHAMLFVGPTGVGKHDFAHKLASAMICEHPHEHMQACGVCKNCLLMKADTFPDFISVAAETNSISVEQVRELIHELTDVAVRVAKAPPEAVTVVISEVEHDKWATADKTIAESRAQTAR